MTQVLELFFTLKPIDEFIVACLDDDGQELEQDWGEENGQKNIDVAINVPPHAVGLVAPWPLDLDVDFDPTIVNRVLHTSYKRAEAWFKINFNKHKLHTLRFTARGWDGDMYCGHIHKGELKSVQLIIEKSNGDDDSAHDSIQIDS